jgi:pimeloyl-ACP methyl ester carboxylesterase
VQGPADGPPLLLLPGDSETSLAWIPVIGALSETYRTYAPDQIYDRGRSVYRREIRNRDDFTKWLDELLTGLDLTTVRLMGHSYGGWLATLFALAHPERVERLVLLSPAATVLPPPPGLVLRAILYDRLPLRCVVKRYLYWYAPDAVRNLETRSVVGKMIEEDLLARRCFKRRRFIIPTVLSDEDWGTLRVPTLFLIGKNEVTYAADKAVRRLSAVAPTVRTAVAEGGDHHLTIVDPGWVSDHVLRFLDAPQT